MLEKLIKSAIISSRIIKIYDEKLDRTVRPTLNIFIRKPFGFGFSTMAKELEEKRLANYVNDFTVAGIIGTVRQGRIYTGSLANSGYRLTIFDEVMTLENKAKKLLNELTEQGTATRSLQGYVEKRIEKAVTGGKYIAEEGKLTLQIHTSCIFGTASEQILQDTDIKMLFSRCFCLNLTMDKEEAIKLKKEGRKIRVDTRRIPEEPIDKVVLPEDVNNLLLEKMEESSLVPETEGGYYTRCHDDLIRLSAVHCVARNDKEINEKDVKFALQFYNLHQIGYLGTQLSEVALKILEICNGKTAKEIAEKVGLKKSQVYKYLNTLLNLNLIGKVGDRYTKRI